MLGRRLPAYSLFFLVAASATFKISTYDIWWHLAYGRWIAGNGEVPRYDVFSFTAAGVERTDHEWGFQVLVYLLHQLGGSAALILAKALLIGVTAALVHRFVARETGLSPAAAALVLVPFVLAGHNRYVLRPDVVSLAFSVVLAAALFKRRREVPTLRDLWWIPPLFALWANLHGGLIVGLVMLLLCLAGRLLELVWSRFRALSWASDGRPRASTLLALWLLALAAGLINPFFHRVYGVAFHITALHESGTFRNLEWLPPQWPAHWLYYLVLVLTATILGLHLRRPHWPAILNLAFVALISLQYVRNLAFFGLLAPIFLTAAIVPREASQLPAWRERISRLLRAPLAVAVLVLLGASLLVANPRFANGLGVDGRRLPVAAAEFLARARPPGQMFNTHAFGGYAIWRLYPQQRVFIDGRDDIFAELRARLGRAAVDSRLWDELLADYGIEYTLLDYLPRLEELRIPDPASGRLRVLRRPYAVNRFPPQAWTLVYFDDVAMVHIRKTSAAAPLIARYGMPNVFPEDVGFQLEAIALGWARRDGAIVELQRKLRQDPGCLRARQLLSAVQSLPLEDLDRVDVGGSLSGAPGRQGGDRGQDRRHRREDLGLEEADAEDMAGDEPRQAAGQQQTGRHAEAGELEAVTYHGPDDACAGGAESQANAHLPCPLADAVGDHAVDADSAEREGGSGEKGQHPGQGAFLGQSVVDELPHGPKGGDRRLRVDLSHRVADRQEEAIRRHRDT